MIKQVDEFYIPSTFTQQIFELEDDVTRFIQSGAHYLRMSEGHYYMKTVKDDRVVILKLREEGETNVLDGVNIEIYNTSYERLMYSVFSELTPEFIIPVPKERTVAEVLGDVINILYNEEFDSNPLVQRIRTDKASMASTLDYYNTCRTVGSVNFFGTDKTPPEPSVELISSSLYRTEGVRIHVTPRAVDMTLGGNIPKPVDHVDPADGNPEVGRQVMMTILKGRGTGPQQHVFLPDTGTFIKGPVTTFPPCRDLTRAVPVVNERSLLEFLNLFDLIMTNYFGTINSFPKLDRFGTHPVKLITKMRKKKGGQRKRGYNVVLYASGTTAKKIVEKFRNGKK